MGKDKTSRTYSISGLPILRYVFFTSLEERFSLLIRIVLAFEKITLHIMLYSILILVISLGCSLYNVGVGLIQPPVAGLI